MPVITNLTFYKFIFVAALLVAEWMFLARFPRQSHFALRLLLAILCMFFCAFLFPILAYNAIYSSLMFTFFFIITIPVAKICCNISWQDCVFCTVAGYSVQHLASVCYGLVTAVGGFDSSPLYSNSVVKLSPFAILIFLEVYALVYWCLYHLFAAKIKRQENVTIKNPPLIILLVATVLVEIVLNAFVTYRRYDYMDFTYYVCASLTNIICTISVLVIQFSLLLQENLTEELDIMHQMRRQELRQFQISKETIEAINIKCHDMRHQIHTLSKAATIDPQALREIESAISIYDSMVKTGNQALDIILAEKSLYCQKNDITVSCIVDGEKLHFMSDADIYSLFGNMLDNAIQSVIQLEQDKRVISITVKAAGKLLSINSHNYYAGEVVLKDGLPETRNPDKQNHGFGVKSMRMIVEKHGGTISFDVADQIFNLNILLPLPDTASI